MAVLWLEVLLEGKLFKDLDFSQLKKAARRYPADPKLQKFAKAKLAISRD